MQLITYPPPSIEQQKAEVLQRYAILNGSRAFDASQSAKTAAQVFGVPIVIAALNKRYRDWFRCSHGVEDEDFAKLQEFCARAHLATGPFIVEDARSEAYFADAPAVYGGPGVVFFAGAPLRNPEGKRFGTLCLIDTRSHPFGSKDLRLLESFAELVSQDICIRSAGRYALKDLIASEKDKCSLYELAMKDPLTRALNRRAFFHFAEREVLRANRHGLDVSTMMIDIDHFKNVNDKYGHAVGDEVLSGLAKTMVDCIRTEDLVGRLGGEEFAMVLPETSPDQARLLAERLRHRVSQTHFQTEKGDLQITISIGISEPKDVETDIVPALKRSDMALYEAKRRGRNRVVMAPPVRWHVADPASFEFAVPRGSMQKIA